MLRLSVSAFLVLSLMAMSGTESSAQSTQSFSIFGNAAPAPLRSSWSSGPFTFGVKFWSTESGQITAIRFYRATTSPSGYVAMLYNNSGTLLGSVNMAQESGPVPGWQVANFTPPISISSNTTYVAAYYTACRSYQSVPYALTNGVTNGPLSAPASATVGGNDVYTLSNNFPTTPSPVNSNLLVDVSFTPATTMPYLTLSFNPANPTVATNAPPGTLVATITASWSNGQPFTGTLTFGPPYSNDNATFSLSGNQLIVNPAGDGLSADGGTVQQVTIVANP
jgi:hypothetical protein